MFGGNKPTSLFGSTSTANTFGQPTASEYNCLVIPLSITTFSSKTATFGQQQQPTSLFGNASTNTFGQPQTTGLFGQAAQPATSGTLFGGTGLSASPFAPASGGTGFGQANTTGLFGQQQQPQSATLGTFGSTSNAFGSTTTGLGGSFGGSAMTGTPLKFIAVNGTDTMLKNGSTQTIGTRHQCLTAMKEYEAKSLEELRFEDYGANRKGPQSAGQQPTSGFGVSSPAAGFSFGSPSVSTNNTFGASTSSTNLFANQNKPFGLQPAQSTSSLFPSTSTAFGQQQNKPLSFGLTNTVAPTLFGGLGGQTQQQPNQQSSLFGQTSTGFGTAAPASTGFNFGSTSTPPKSLFGTQVSQPTGNSLFGQQQPQTAFGNLSAGATQPKSLFNPAGFGSTIGQSNTSTAFPSFGGTSVSTTAAPSLFGQQPQTSTAFSFNTASVATSKPAFSFGSNTTSLSAFGSTAPATTSLFGQTNQSSFSSGLSFGSTPSAGSSLLQQQQSSLFNPTGSTFGFGQSLQQSQMQQQTQQNVNHELLLSRLRTLPYGTNPLFQNDPASLASMTVLGNNNNKFTTDSKVLMQYKMNAKPIEIKRVPVSNNNNSPGTSNLFADFDEEEGKLCTADVFQPRKNVKRLVLRPKKPENVSPQPDSTSPDDESMFSNAVDRLQPISLNSSASSGQIESTVMEFGDNIQRNRVALKKTSLGKGFNVTFESTLDQTDEGSQSMLQEKEPLKCGLIQSRKDYYTIPKLDDIDCFYDEERKTCIVSSFTIGRKGYGSIFWDCDLDLTGLNLDEIVHIRRKEVIVYPDDDDKPEVGHGLNLPAQVTLDQVWPIDSTTKEIVRDIERLQDMKYAERLESITIKQGAVFKDYRPETGSWVFNVKHFSKYGLKDEEEDMITGSSPKETTVKTGFQSTVTAVKTTTPLVQETQVSQQHSSVLRPIGQFSTPFEQIFQNFAKPEDFVYKGPAKVVVKEPLATQADHFEGLRNALFDDECHALMEGDCPQFAHQLEDKKPFKRQRYLTSNSPVVGEVVEISPKTGERYYLKTSIRLQPKMPILQPQVCIKKRELKFLINEVPLKNKSVSDIASFKLTPVQKVRFFQSGSARFLTIQGKQVTLYSVLDDEIMVKNNPSITERMEVQLKKHTIIKSSSHGTPVAEVRKKIVNSLNPRSLNLLILALYGDIVKTNGGSLTPYEEEETRRNCLIDWLCQRNKSNYKLPSDPMSKILYFLSVNDVKAACDEGVKSLHPRLSLLLSCSLCTFSRDDCLAQLDSWKTSGADAFISNEILKIFVLISGSMNWSLSTGQVVSAVQGLEWSQQLALNLIYNQETGLEDCISFLDLDMNDSSIEFHVIMNLFGDNQWNTLEECVSFEEAWFLHQSLLAFDGLPFVSVMSDALHGQLVSRFIHLDVKLAAFVALHIKDDYVRHKTLTEVLEISAASMSEEDEVFLTKSLLIDEKDVAAAKAIYFKSSFNDLEEAQSLLKAGKWSQSHDVLISRVFPDLVIQGDVEVLTQLLTQLKEGQNCISNWFTSGGHIYDVYAACLTKSVEEVMEMTCKHAINLNGLKTPTNKHTLAKTEMIQKILSFTSSSQEVVSSSDMEGEKQTEISEYGQEMPCLVSAPIPDDSVIPHLNHKTRELLNNLLDSSSLKKKTK